MSFKNFRTKRTNKRNPKNFLGYIYFACFVAAAVVLAFNMVCHFPYNPFNILFKNDLRFDHLENESQNIISNAIFASSMLRPSVSGAILGFVLPTALSGSLLMLFGLMFFGSVKIKRFKNAFAHMVVGTAMGLLFPGNGISAWIVACAMFFKGASNVMSICFGIVASSINVFLLDSLFEKFAIQFIAAKFLYFLLCSISVPFFVILKYRLEASSEKVASFGQHKASPFAIEMISNFAKSFSFLIVPVLSIPLSCLMLRFVLSNMGGGSMDLDEIFGTSIALSISQFDIANGGVLYYVPTIVGNQIVENEILIAMLSFSSGFGLFALMVIWKTFSSKTATFVLSLFVIGILGSGILV